MGDVINQLVTNQPVERLPYATNSAGVELWLATRAVFWPWRFREYRGWMKESAKALGVSHRTTERWAFPGSRGVGKPSCERIAALLESRAAQASELARLWRAHAATLPDAHPVPWFRKSRLLERDGWRSRPRKG